jgi:hypothetical protein
MVRVAWLDSCAEADWLHDGDASLHVAEIESVGWLIEDTATQITIAQSLDWEGKTGERLTVPKGVVTKITRLHDVRFP